MSTASIEKANRISAASHSIDVRSSSPAALIEAVGRHFVRYSLVLVLVWIGAMKFTAYEANGISGLVANSPLMSWAYQVMSVQQFSALLGVSELLIASLIAARPFSARLSAIGSGLAIGMFVTTLSFLLSTPGVVESSLGFPGISVLPGQFLLKDFVLLGAAIWTAGEALRAAQTHAADKAQDVVAAEANKGDTTSECSSGACSVH